MDKKRLIILGNGFDLYHGLKTSSHNFIEFTRKEFSNTNCGWYWYLKDNYDMKCSNEKWNDVEKNLGEDEQLYVGLKFDWKKWNLDKNKSLKDWLKPQIEKICELKKNNKNHPFDDCFKESDNILSFNYTNTISELYNAKNIVYIHGDYFSNNFIFGGIKLTIYEGNNSEKEKAFFKNVYQISKNVLENDDRFKNNDLVYVIGHNIGSVQPYEQKEKSFFGLSYVDLHYYKTLIVQNPNAIFYIVTYIEDIKTKMEIKNELLSRTQDIERLFQSALQDICSSISISIKYQVLTYKDIIEKLKND